MKYIKNLPLNDDPEIFGLHENANMTYAQNETFAILDKFLLMQAKTGSVGGKSQEEVGKLKQLSNVIHMAYKVHSIAALLHKC